jgi:transposase InsO family protein
VLLYFTQHGAYFWKLGLEKNLGGKACMIDGLYYLDNDISPMVAAALSYSPLVEVLLLHHRLGHLPFGTMNQLYPSLFNKINKEKLVCDACQYGKQTRSSYVLSNNRSSVPLETIHSDVWGPSVVNSLLGERWFLTFIDGFSRCTWLYLLKWKSDVFSAFKDFYALLCNQYDAKVKIFRSDNGTEYVNNEFDCFLFANGIIHQTTCINTSAQNGIAEKK